MKQAADVGVLYDMPQILAQEVREFLDISAEIVHSIEEVNTNSPAAFQDYVSTFKKYDLLTQEQEAELFRQYREGNMEAYRTIIYSNIKLAINYAVKEFQKCNENSLTLADYIQESIFGLFKANESFDESLGYKYSTHATWKIRKAIQDAVRTTAYIIKLPVSLLKNRSKYQYEQEKLRQELKREPKLEEIAAELDLSQEKVNKIVDMPRVAYSLDAPVNEDQVLADILPSTKQINSDLSNKNNVIRKALQVLDERQYTIITHAFGIGVDRLSLRGIGKLMKTSDITVKKHYLRGLDKIRKSKFIHELEDLY